MLVNWNYHPRQSLMEGIDPRARWIFSFAYLFSVTLFWDARFLLFFFLLGLGWYALGKISWREARRAWLLVSLLVFTMVLVNTIITGGGAGGVVPPGGHLVWPQGVPLPWGGVFRFGLTWERLWFALCQFLRIFGISAVFITIPFTMDPRLYGVTFRGLGLPDRFAYVTELAFRFVPTLARDFAITFDAQRARGYEIERIGRNPIRHILRIAPLLVPVTMSAILAAEDVANAMDLRGFGQKPRTWLYELRYRRSDYFLIASSAILLLTSLILRWNGYGGFWIPPWIG
uniref:Cobalt/nickel transport system permease protein n=1 Tax=uncultured Chloroflexota bacterium TaxID=166587 RepID=H5SBH5_9CHLR|nr:cobalt/nickel transport system permease protein [uncultured Chloroflexota bacterium]